MRTLPKATERLSCEIGMLAICLPIFWKTLESCTNNNSRKYENCFLRTVLFHLGCVVDSPQLHPPCGTFDTDVLDTLWNLVRPMHPGLPKAQVPPPEPYSSAAEVSCLRTNACRCRPRKSPEAESAADLKYLSCKGLQKDAELSSRQYSCTYTL